MLCFDFSTPSSVKRKSRFESRFSRFLRNSQFEKPKEPEVEVFCDKRVDISCDEDKPSMPANDLQSEQPIVGTDEKEEQQRSEEVSVIRQAEEVEVAVEESSKTNPNEAESDESKSNDVVEKDEKGVVEELTSDVAAEKDVKAGEMSKDREEDKDQCVALEDGAMDSKAIDETVESPKESFDQTDVSPSELRQSESAAVHWSCADTHSIEEDKTEGDSTQHETHESLSNQANEVPSDPVDLSSHMDSTASPRLSAVAISDPPSPSHSEDGESPSLDRLRRMHAANRRQSQLFDLQNADSLTPSQQLLYHSSVSIPPTVVSRLAKERPKYTESDLVIERKRVELEAKRESEEVLAVMNDSLKKYESQNVRIVALLLRRTSCRSSAFS